MPKIIDAETDAIRRKQRNREYQRKYREAKRAIGEKEVAVFLTAASLEILSVWSNEGESQSDTINRILKDWVRLKVAEFR